MSRATLIKLVHAGARHLFGDEDARKDWQEDRTGHRSCSDMSNADLENLVAELRRKKALRPTNRPVKGGKTPADKIRALWIDMAKQKLIRDGSDRAMGRYINRLTGRYKPEWLPTPEAMRVIESLKQWRDRLIQQQEKNHAPT